MKQAKKPVKVLYIEDDRSSRILVRKLLKEPGFAFLEAATGLEGLDKAVKTKPDLILMDINLPDISGTELTTKIKNTPELKDTIIVALTALKNSHSRDLTLLAGCDGYLTKPIDVQKFAGQVLQFLKGKKEALALEKKEHTHGEYERTLVEHLTDKIRELSRANRKLSSTSQRLKGHSAYLEKILLILNHLQSCASPQDLKKTLVDEITENFHYDRCIFIDVNAENRVMQINYARGIEQDEWNKYTYPFNNAFFQRLFEEKQVVFVPRLSLVEDVKLQKMLRDFGTRQFFFAYLGIPVNPYRGSEIRQGIQPMLQSFLPRLYDQEDSDIDIMMERLQEYMASETLYRGGFVFLDSYHSRRRIYSYEYRFLESLFRTTSYMYQNLLLMEELKLLFVRAEKEAITDPLTNLFNYRYFMQQLNREISRDQRHRSRFSLILIDIDFFKMYNDTFGHQAGDLILRRIARLMMKNTRTSDTVARYGGEEFVIICPELDKPGAIQMAEKIRKIVQKMDLPKPKGLPYGELTISLGIATFPEDGQSAYRLIRSADQALYQAKESGRNKVCVA
ncbi:MAG TPA: diguanylate cyclase [Caldithrix sp.]|nr:diguanylate cyclase [Caldithrix sp.]